ncbi:MAG: hypothetical protein LBU83_07735 [Bacteroidales bacterium]|nr:hypothetical protein [Bacteroidales bacterium]
MKELEVVAFFVLAPAPARSLGLDRKDIDKTTHSLTDRWELIGQISVIGKYVGRQPQPLTSVAVAQHQIFFKIF